MPNAAGDRRPLSSLSPSAEIAAGYSEPIIGVLALQGAFAAHEKMIESLGALARRVRSEGDLDGLHGLVVPGGESTTMSNLLVACALIEPLKRLLREGLPVFGTCAGMILLASEIRDGRPDQVKLGVIDVCVRRNAYGRQVDSFETTIHLDEMNRSIPAVFIRAPAIESMGADVEVLARIDDQPCLVRQGNALAASFHPELTTDVTVHEIFLRIVRECSSHVDSNTNTSTVDASREQE